jgi:hypothetical protein
MVDRIERHDILNAVMLAAVLLLLGFGILTAADSLASTVDEGLIEATKDDDPSAATPPAGATSSSVPEDDAADETTTSTLPETRPPGEVLVRVANGARRRGVAGAGTEAVIAAGYQTLPPKNGPTMDASVVYYANGYAAEAAGVAEVLGLEPTAIEAMPSDPGVEIEGANLIALLGVNSDF